MELRFEVEQILVFGHATWRCGSHCTAQRRKCYGVGIRLLWDKRKKPTKSMLQTKLTKVRKRAGLLDIQRTSTFTNTIFKIPHPLEGGLKVLKWSQELCRLGQMAVFLLGGWGVKIFPPACLLFYWKTSVLMWGLRENGSLSFGHSEHHRGRWRCILGGIITTFLHLIIYFWVFFLTPGWRRGRTLVDHFILVRWIR